MNSLFSEQILGDKLSKLNSTQQCIETLSHWCIFHRSNAELVVTTWGKQFHNSEMVQKVPLLYLANDILQNSRRKGNEFVSEFWKVLPGALSPQPNHSYQSILVSQQTMPNQTTTTQTQYHMLPNPPSQQYMQLSGAMMTPYGYSNIPPLPPGPPPPPPHMVSPMVPLSQQPLQMPQQQQIPLTQQPQGPSFHPFQPPGMYYGQLHPQ